VVVSVLRRGGQTGRVSVSTKIINDRGMRGVVSVLRRGGQTGKVTVSTKINNDMAKVQVSILASFYRGQTCHK